MAATFDSPEDLNQETTEAISKNGVLSPEIEGFNFDHASDDNSDEKSTTELDPDENDNKIFTLKGVVKGPNTLSWSTDLSLAITTRSRIQIIDFKGSPFDFQKEPVIHSIDIEDREPAQAYLNGAEPEFHSVKWSPKPLHGIHGNSLIAAITVNGMCSLYASIPSLADEKWERVFSFVEPLKTILNYNSKPASSEVQDCAWSELLPDQNTASFLALGSSSGHITLWRVCKTSVYYLETLKPNRYQHCAALLAFSSWVGNQCRLAVAYGNGSLTSYLITSKASAFSISAPRQDLVWQGACPEFIKIEPMVVVLESDDVLVSTMAWGCHGLAIAKPCSLAVWVPENGIVGHVVDCQLPISSLMWMGAYLHTINIEGNYTCFQLLLDSNSLLSMEGKPALDILRDSLNYRLLKPPQHTSDSMDDEEEEEDEERCTRFVRVFGAALSPNGVQVAILFSQYSNRLEYKITSTETAHVLIYDLGAFTKAITGQSLLGKNLQLSYIPPGLPMCSFLWDYMAATSYSCTSAFPSPGLKELIDFILLQLCDDAPVSPRTELFAKMILFLYHSLKNTAMAKSSQFLQLQARALSVSAYNLICHLKRLDACLMTFPFDPNAQNEAFVANILFRIQSIAKMLEPALNSQTEIGRWSLSQVASLKGVQSESNTEQCPICFKSMTFENFYQAVCYHAQDSIDPPTTWRRCQITFAAITTPYTMYCKICDTLVGLASPEQSFDSLEPFLEFCFTYNDASLSSSLISPAGWRCPHCASQLY